MIMTLVYFKMFIYQEYKIYLIYCENSKLLFSSVLLFVEDAVGNLQAVKRITIFFFLKLQFFLNDHYSRP